MSGPLSELGSIKYRHFSPGAAFAGETSAQIKLKGTQVGTAQSVFEARQVHIVNAREAEQTRQAQKNNDAALQVKGIGINVDKHA